MIQVKVKENESVERALKRFKKKFERTGVLRELRGRQQFTKKSVKRRFEILNAAYKQKTYGHLDD
ncbi:30S ribosomal protein S21 [Marinilongibacter aquaticus]|uniref:30S ribosomal protein S21 n=1 Tax=Marinilongibacter aquaticus TaxID=2975157 RepID=UPI0021BD9194|nr:30S ribosomal protein S21 [Marinilongibacter aquaticus]UBM58448.1 30S ribosomal protein S21 [Marinilongibacter aquaticus]